MSLAVLLLIIAVVLLILAFVVKAYQRHLLVTAVIVGVIGIILFAVGSTASV